jgi:uncharacterized protein YcfL
MKYLSKIILGLTVVIFFAGCQNTPLPAHPNWPISIDNSLRNKIVATNSISKERVDGLAQVQFALKNLLPHTAVNALYQVQWFDKNGFKITSVTGGFHKIHLAPGESGIYNIVATSPNVRTYKINIVNYAKNKERIPNETKEYR